MSAARLQTLLGLEDEELLQILGSDPIAVITGAYEAARTGRPVSLR